MQASSKQIIRARAIMSKLPHFGEIEKGIAVLDITGGRTSRISQMTENEASILIDSLQRLTPNPSPNGGGRWQPPNDRRTKMQRKIIAMAHEIGWNEAPPQPSPNGEGAGKRKIDMKKLNDWCAKTGYLRKEFNKYTYEELPRLVAQFEKVYHYYLKNFNV